MPSTLPHRWPETLYLLHLLTKGRGQELPLAALAFGAGGGTLPQPKNNASYICVVTPTLPPQRPSRRLNVCEPSASKAATGLRHGLRPFLFLLVVLRSFVDPEIVRDGRETTFLEVDSGPGAVPEWVRGATEPLEKKNVCL